MANRRKLSIGLAIVTAIAAAGGYAAYDFWKRQQSTPTDIVLYGNVDIREADLAFDVAGRIESMLVEEGDAVENGQLTATLEVNIYQAEVEAAKAGVGTQRGRLDRQFIMCNRITPKNLLQRLDSTKGSSVRRSLHSLWCRCSTTCLSRAGSVS